jgi:hypothetical protein
MEDAAALRQYRTLNSPRYKALSEEGDYTHQKCRKIGGAVSPPFKLKMSELNAKQLYFLASNGHLAEFSRSLTCFRMDTIGWEVKRGTIVFLLTTHLPCEQMLLTLVAASPLSYLVFLIVRSFVVK